MNFLKKLVIKWVREDWESARGEKGLVAVSVDHSRIEDDPVLNFRIYDAQNGKILEFSKYDRKTDRSNRSIYIVEKDKDITEYVGKCLSLELLR
jgi:hypothetical protein